MSMAGSHVTSSPRITYAPTGCAVSPMPPPAPPLPAEQVVEATTYVETKQKTGNVVLTVSPDAGS